jgi:hypothetical protein
VKNVKTIANKKNDIYHAIDQYENNKWSPIGFEDGETENFQADDEEKENEEEYASICPILICTSF